MRKQFAVQTATAMFLTYVCCLSNRAPSRFHLSRKTGLMYMTEILPGQFWQSCSIVLITSVCAWTAIHLDQRKRAFPPDAQHAALHHSLRSGRCCNVGGDRDREIVDIDRV